MGIPLADLARILRRDERTVRDWLSAKQRVPWWVPQYMRLRHMERAERFRQMGFSSTHAKLGIVRGDVIVLAERRPKKATNHRLAARRFRPGEADELALLSTRIAPIQNSIGLVLSIHQKRHPSGRQQPLQYYGVDQHAEHYAAWLSRITAASAPAMAARPWAQIWNGGGRNGDTARAMPATPAQVDGSFKRFNTVRMLPLVKAIAGRIFDGQAVIRNELLQLWETTQDEGSNQLATQHNERLTGNLRPCRNNAFQVQNRLPSQVDAGRENEASHVLPAARSFSHCVMLVRGMPATELITVADTVPQVGQAHAADDGFRIVWRAQHRIVVAAHLAAHHDAADSPATSADMCVE
ncbi:hypothetical protein [Janthinobacterium sp. J1-1]|uniref:hypothetical protein n=1 Tax=unclassified Janthinobacterium TaxID=2610881 RepID=UPI00281146F0|nr:hypothetical protein [Janthinobacterium sp. J1-1]